MRTIIWFLYFWAYLIVLFPWKLVILAMKDSPERDRKIRRLVGNWARRLMKLAGGRVTVKGLENIPQEPVIFVVNHSGYFDIPLFLGYVEPVAMLAKKELGKLPFIHGWMKLLRCVFVDRKDPRAAAKSLEKVVEVVNNGHNYAIFPEGTRSKDGTLGRFKGGAFKVAMKTGATVVPCAIAGTNNMMKKGSLWLHPSDISITVLEPISTVGYTKEDFLVLPALCREKIGEAL